VSAPHRLVIVGNGMAGARLAEHVIARADRRRFDIVLFGDEPGGNYNRILLSNVLAGGHRNPGSDIVLNPIEWYSSNGITLHRGVAVRALDLACREVIDDRGVRHRYDSLVLATGARPIVPSIDGLTAGGRSLRPGAFVFRTVDDCAQIAAAAVRAQHAIIIGGGLLGLEAARGLLGHGLSVRVVHVGSHAMDAHLDRSGGRVLQGELERIGVPVLTGRTTVRVIGRARIEGVEFSDRSREPCDLVVIAAGVRPNVEVAAAAGLAVNRGVIVDDGLACQGAADVYAIGDCMEHRGQVYGLVAPAWQQADVLADRLTGRKPAVYVGSRVATKLKVAGLDVAVMGARDEAADDEIVCYTEPSRGIYTKLIVREERLHGAIVIGLPDATALVVQRFLDDSPVPPARSEMLFPPAGRPPQQAVAEIPDAARICDCNAVPKAAIVDAVLGGARSLRAVCERTRAGTGCGSCRPEVQRIVDAIGRDGVDGPHGIQRASARVLSQSHGGEMS
jgi:nitrite reductase (NADH) large subunit